MYFVNYFNNQNKMVTKKAARNIRKIHRYLGLFLGIQFLFWTISGMYFSWTDIDDIHGDHFKKESPEMAHFTDLLSPSALDSRLTIQNISLREINATPYYWINKEYLYNAHTGELKKGITEKEALSVAQRVIKSDLKVKDITLITETDEHHEYRERLLPAYVISYEDPSDVKVYISANDGAYQTVRHNAWRWFDFLWMTHTMDYDTRDDFNTWVLRGFSLLGLITVLSGFLLWYISSPTIRRIKKRIRAAFQRSN